MICLLALSVFGFLGIFSVYYRNLAREAFSCVLRRMVLKPCTTGFDQRLKSKITARLMKFPKIARVWYKHFEAISWVFVGLMFTSFFFSARGLYNLAVYGACEPHSTECIFNPGAVYEGVECEEQCLCEQETCEPPEYKGCNGNCTCRREVCGIG